VFGPIIVFALFALVFPLGKKALLYSDPIFLSSMRMIIAGLCFLSYYFITYRNKSRIVTLELSLQLFFLAFCNVYLTNICEFWGLQYLSVAKASFIYNLTPFISALIAYLIFKEKMSYRKWLGLAIGFIGFFPILLDSSKLEMSLGSIGFLSWPEIALFTAVTSTAVGWILMQHLSQKKLPLSFLNGWSMLIGGVIGLCTSYLVEVWDYVPVKNWSFFLQYMIPLAIISNIICYALYSYLLRYYTPTFLTFFGFTCPLWAAFYGWLFCNELIANSFIISSIIVIIGLYIFYQEELKSHFIINH